MSNEQTRSLTDLRNLLSGLSIAELRKRASTNYGLKLTRESTKEDIINTIIGLAQKSDYAMAASSDVPAPGWARIRVHPVPGKPTSPFYVNCNGYACWIPFNTEVDIPRKLIALLNNAEEYRVESEDGEERRVFELSYPFTVIHDSPGPDPRPGLEVLREKILQPKREFLEKFGYWPTDKVLKEYRASLRGVLIEDGNS